MWLVFYQLLFSSNGDYNPQSQLKQTASWLFVDITTMLMVNVPTYSAVHREPKQLYLIALLSAAYSAVHLVSFFVLFQLRLSAAYSAVHQHHNSALKIIQLSAAYSAVH